MIIGLKFVTNQPTFNKYLWLKLNERYIQNLRQDFHEDITEFSIKDYINIKQYTKLKLFENSIIRQIT